MRGALRKKAPICFLTMLLLCRCKANRTNPANDKAVTLLNGV